jgi:pimeloyl-ACP methyl ester carboxylesterase
MPERACREITLRDGRTLAYAEYGSPSGAAVIHCHGVPSARVEADLIIKDAIAARLGLRIIVPDRPGMGRSDFKPDRRIVDWPDDVQELADALRLDTFAVLGSSGGAPFAAACAVRMPARVRVLGLLGAVAPTDAPGVLRSINAPMRMMMRLARVAPAVVRAIFRLNLRTIRRGGPDASKRMVAWAPEPDRLLLQRRELREAFVACFKEACRQGVHGPVLDLSLIARPWGFDLSDVSVPVLLWHGERDRNVPVAAGHYLVGAIPHCRAIFYADDAHLSVPLRHQEDILGAIATAAPCPAPSNQESAAGSCRPAST